MSDRRTLPVIQQTEIAECGLACLAMVACWHGHDVDLASLRRRFPISIKGAGLSRLMAIARRLDLDARPLRLEPDQLHGIAMPCVLHWDLNHFVVLERIDGDRARLHDPARGVVTMSLAELGRHFTGVALELVPAAGFRPQVARQPLSLRALVGHVTGVRRALVQVLALALALELLTLALPLSLQWVIDHVLVSADLGLLAVIGIAFLCVVLVQSAIAAMRGWIVADVGASLGAQWLDNLFAHLLRLPLDYFGKRSVGGVLSRFVSVQAVQQTLTGSFIEAILDGLTVVLVLVLLAVYSPLLTAIVVAASMLYALLRWLAYRRLRLLKEEQLVHLARQQGRMIETMQGVQTVKLGNLEAQRRAQVANATVEVANREAAINRLAATFTGLARLVAGTQRVVILWIAAWLVIEGRFTAGMLVVFVTYSELFATRTGNLVDKLVELRLLRLHADRIADIALEPPETDAAVSWTGPPPAASLSAQGLAFRYGEDEPWVLQDCSLHVAAGSSVAITGPSGCGKTTLAKVLLGLLVPQAGTVQVGGVDIRRLGLSAYRERVAAVLQDDVLFAGSIAQNIAAFDVDADPAAIERAARAAQVHDDIAAMPMGYESLVGDMGSSLSGGQKQRVLLARALFRQPDILLLDEATSHLDMEREHAINDAIARLSITRIVIAHRPDTIRSADRVIRLHAGRVVSDAEPDSHDPGT